MGYLVQLQCVFSGIFQFVTLVFSGFCSFACFFLLMVSLTPDVFFPALLFLFSSYVTMYLFSMYVRLIIFSILV